MSDNSKFKSNMRILLLLTTPSLYGGMEETTNILLEGLKKRKIEAYVLVDRNSILIPILEQHNQSFFTYDYWTTFKYNSPYSDVNAQCADCLYNVLLDVVQKYKINIIHSQKEYEYFACQSVSEKMKIKHIVQVHNGHISLLQYYFKCDIFTVVDAELVEPMKEKNVTNNLGIKAIEYMRPIFNESKFLNFRTNRTKQDFFKQEFNLTIEDDFPLICLIGNLYLVKNHDIMVHVLYQLREKYNQDVYLIIAGTDQEGRMRKMMKLSRDLYVDDELYFLGFTNQTAELLLHSDMMVLPSLAEGFGIVMLEAALMGTPVLITKYGGPGTVIKDGVNGLLLDPRDSKQIADQIMRVIKDKGLGEQMAERLYDLVVKKYGTEEIIEKWVELYKSALNLTKRDL